MNENRRQKKIASLLKKALSRSVDDIIQSSYSCFIAITRIEMSKDLKSAYVFLSVYGNVDPEEVLKHLQENNGYFRKAVASKTNLKYNPKLIFSLDSNIGQEEKISKILESLKNHD